MQVSSYWKFSPFFHLAYVSIWRDWVIGRSQSISCQCTDGLVHLNLSTCRGTSPIASNQILAVHDIWTLLYPGHGWLHIILVSDYRHNTRAVVSHVSFIVTTVGEEARSGTHNMLFIVVQIFLYFALFRLATFPAKGFFLESHQKEERPHRQYCDHHLLL